MTGSLRTALEKAMAERGCSMAALTVLDKKVDPFRLDTPANHRDAEWLATTAADLGLGDRKIHQRGLHYMVITRLKPDGTPYVNTADNWEWIQDACNYARFLGYIPFDQIEDHRNDAPVVREHEPPDPYAYLSTTIRVDIPREVRPTLYTGDFRGVQPFRLVMIGEKSSLEPVLGSVASDYEADLYLPTGEMSNTLIYRIAKTATADGRPVKVLYFSDCDPSGWQMPISVGRKLQALAELLGGFEFDVYRVALRPDQVHEYELPTAPLKDTEKRADKWQQAMAVEQTEIDALAALHPELLDQIARRALDHFYDHTLADRVEQYRQEWLGRAWDMLSGTLDSDRLDAIRADAERKLADMRQQIAELNSQLQIRVDYNDLPLIDLPGPVLGGGAMSPLISSEWEFAEQCQALIDSKQYLDGAG